MHLEDELGDVLDAERTNPQRRASTNGAPQHLLEAKPRVEAEPDGRGVRRGAFTWPAVNPIGIPMKGHTKGCVVLATRSLCTTTAASSPRGQPEWHDAVEARPRPRHSQQWQVVAAVHLQELLLDPRGLMDIVCIMLFVGASHSCYPAIKQQMQDLAQ